MKRTFTETSGLLFGLSVVLWIMLNLFESDLARMSPGTERLITFLGLVLLLGIGAALGIMSLIRKEGGAWLAILSVVLNILFALFHLMIVLIAG